MVNERTSGACRRSTIRSDRIHLRRAAPTSRSTVRYRIRADRTDAQPSGTAVSSSNGSSSGCSTPRALAAASSPTAPVSRSTVLSTTPEAAAVPRESARCSSSRKSASSRAASSTAEVSSYSRISTMRVTLGCSLACDHPASAWKPARSMTARPTRASEGSAARTRCGVGPAASSAVSTPVVASSPNAVKNPAARLQAMVTAVSRGPARQASRSACPTSTGSRRAMVRRPVSASSPVRAYHFSSLSSGRAGPDEASLPGDLLGDVPGDSSGERRPRSSRPGHRNHRTRIRPPRFTHAAHKQSAALQGRDGGGCHISHREETA